MIRACADADVPAIERIINEAASAYRGVIPAECCHDPYMSRDELRAELAAGVAFTGWQDPAARALVGVMGRQTVRDALLVRHAYVLPGYQRHGIGAKLLEALMRETAGLLLVGTWAAAEWAIRFYRRHGFVQASDLEKERLLTTYWSIPPLQRQNSVVLVHAPKIRD